MLNTEQTKRKGAFYNHVNSFIWNQHHKKQQSWHLVQQERGNWRSEPQILNKNLTKQEYIEQRTENMSSISTEIKKFPFLHPT